LHLICLVTILLRLLELGLSLPVALFLVYNHGVLQPDAPSAYTSCSQVSDEVQFYVIWSWIYLAGIFLFCVCSITQEISVFIASSIGTPSNSHLRQDTISTIYAVKLYLMPPFQFLITVLVFFVMAFTRDGLLRCLVEFGGDDTWLERHLWTLVACTSGVITMMVVELIIYGILYFSRASGLLWHKASDEVRRNHHSELTVLDEEEELQQKDEEWQRRCARCCCCCGICCCFAFGGTDLDKNDFASAGHVLTDLFDAGGNLDIVFSDVYMAWQLLKLVQKQRRRETLRALQQEATVKGFKELATTSSELFTEDGHSMLALAADRFTSDINHPDDTGTGRAGGRPQLRSTLQSIRGKLQNSFRMWVSKCIT
jgi:hypothetical protein